MNLINQKNEQFALYDWQKQLNTILEESINNIVIKKSRQIGMTTMLEYYMKNHPEKQFIYITKYSDIKLPNVKRISPNSAPVGIQADEIIFDEASYYDLAESIKYSVNCLKSQGKIIVVSSVRYDNDYFWQLTKNNHYRQLSYHWSICPHLNSKYERGEVESAIIDFHKSNMDADDFLAEYEMIPKKFSPPSTTTLSFRLTIEQESKLMEAIRLESLTKGKMITKTEYIISKILP